jgi:hypothetical protein
VINFDAVALKELLENEVLPIVREFLQVRGLTLSEEKTKITHIDKGFHYCPVKKRARSINFPRSEVIFVITTKQGSLWAKVQILADSRY